VNNAYAVTIKHNEQTKIYRIVEQRSKNNIGVVQYDRYLDTYADWY